MSASMSGKDTEANFLRQVLTLPADMAVRRQKQAHGHQIKNERSAAKTHKRQGQPFGGDQARRHKHVNDGLKNDHEGQ